MPAFGGIARPGAVMVARAEPAPYQVVSGAELGGVASGAPPAPPAQARPVLPAVPATAVPWTPDVAGQPAPGGGAVPAGAPAGTQTVTESRPLGPGGKEGSISYSVKTPEGLDLDRRAAEISKEVDRHFGDVPEAKDLSHLGLVRSLQSQIINDYTPEQRAEYMGVFTPYVLGVTRRSDPRYQRFLELNAAIRRETGGDKSGAPTGMESSAADYEEALRTSVDTVDGMLRQTSVYANMHRSDLTPEKQQRLINEAPVHYGPYPWGEETAAPQKTPTSPPPTTTTSPFVVDRLYHVQPPR